MAIVLDIDSNRGACQIQICRFRIRDRITVFVLNRVAILVSHSPDNVDITLGNVVARKVVRPVSVLVDGNGIGCNNVAVFVRVGHDNVVARAAAANRHAVAGRIVSDILHIHHREYARRVLAASAGPKGQAAGRGGAKSAERRKRERRHAVSADLGEGEIAPRTGILSPPRDAVIVDEDQLIALVVEIDEEIADDDRLSGGHDDQEIVAVLFEGNNAFRCDGKFYNRRFVKLKTGYGLTMLGAVALVDNDCIHGSTP